MDLPDEMAAVYHRSYGADGSASCRKLESPLRFPVSLGLVNVELFDGTISTAGVDGVAGWAPAGTHTPGRNTVAGADTGDRVGLTSVPDSKGSVHGGGEEGCRGCLSWVMLRCGVRGC